MVLNVELSSGLHMVQVCKSPRIIELPSHIFTNLLVFVSLLPPGRTLVDSAGITQSQLQSVVMLIAMQKLPQANILQQRRYRWLRVLLLL